MNARLAAAVVYPIVLRPGSVPEWLEPGPVPFIERAVPQSDELTDRGRAFPPYIGDVIFGLRWHTPVEAMQNVQQTSIVRAWQQRGIGLRWIEVIRFIDERESDTLGRIAAGRYPELLDGLAVLHIETGAGDESQLRHFLSRGAQPLHDEARSLLSPVGDLRRETADRLMETSELPFLVISAVDDDAEPARSSALGHLGRSDSSGRTAAIGGWSLTVWPDACAISAKRSTEDPFRLARRETWVSMSVMLDAVLIRLAQHHALSMLARRAADGAVSESGQARDLHASALRIRSKVWWPMVSSTPYIDGLASLLALQWGLEPLAQAVFDDTDGLAQHAELVATERLNRLVFVLTAGALGIAAISLIVQIASADRVAIGATAAALAAVLCASVAAATRRSGGR